MYETKYNVMMMFHKIQEYEKLEIKVCPDLSQLISDHALSIQGQPYFKSQNRPNLPISAF